MPNLKLKMAVAAISVAMLVAGAGAANASEPAPRNLSPGAAAKAYIRIACPLNDSMNRYAQSVDAALAGGSRSNAQRIAAATRKKVLNSRDAVRNLARQVRGPSSAALDDLAPALATLGSELGRVSKAKSELSFVRATESVMDALSAASVLAWDVRDALDLPIGYCPN